MNKIQEEFEIRAGNMGYDLTKRDDNTYNCFNTMLLETGYLMAMEDGKIQIYYTPEEYKTITGKDYPDEALVWFEVTKNEWIVEIFCEVKRYSERTVIVQTAQPAPEADYKEG